MKTELTQYTQQLKTHLSASHNLKTAEGNLALALSTDGAQVNKPVDSVVAPHAGHKLRLLEGEKKLPRNQASRPMWADNGGRMGRRTGSDTASAFDSNFLNRKLENNMTNGQVEHSRIRTYLDQFKRYGGSDHGSVHKFAKTLMTHAFFTKEQKIAYLKQLLNTKHRGRSVITVDQMWKKARPETRSALLNGFVSPNPPSIASIFGKRASQSLLRDSAMNITQKAPSSAKVHVMRDLLEGIAARPKGAKRQMLKLFRRLKGNSRDLFINAVGSSASLPEYLAKIMSTSDLCGVKLKNPGQFGERFKSGLLTGISKIPNAGGSAHTSGDVVRRIFQSMTGRKKRAVLKKICTGSGGGIKSVLATQRDQNKSTVGMTFLSRHTGPKVAGIIRNTFIQLARQAYQRPDVSNEKFMGRVLSYVRSRMTSEGKSILREGGISINIKDVVQLQGKLSKTTSEATQNTKSNSVVINGSEWQRYLRAVRNYKDHVHYDDLAVRVHNWGVGRSRSFKRSFDRVARSESRVYRGGK
jgi:hypothetical protein